MEETILIALISALGVKEIWNIIKEDSHIDMLVAKIEGLESKINTLIEENIQLKVKIAKMEERIIFNAKNRIKK